MCSLLYQPKTLLQRYPRLHGLARKIRDHLASPHNEDIRTKVIELRSEKLNRGDVLLSFINEPFLLAREQAGFYGQHSHYGTALDMADAFLELGYNVDVIRWNNNEFLPQKDYTFFIDTRLNLGRIGPLLNKDCLKIMFIDTAHWLFHMTAQYRRLLALQQRKGVTLPLRKTVDPNWGIEHADCAVINGNAFTMSTYCYANKPLYWLPVVSPIVCPWPDQKDFHTCQKHFLWMGSLGLVHKGLDLVLDAFAELPEYHLTVCGPIQNEPEFERAYYKELYQTPNIHTLGWVETSSPAFGKIVNQCLGVIYPSCSEGGGGSVTTCMHAGLIPIVSYEASIDVDDFGIILKDSSVEEIKNTIQSVSGFSTDRLEGMARRAWEAARAKYTRERFTEEFRKLLEIFNTTHRKG